MVSFTIVKVLHLGSCPYEAVIGYLRKWQNLIPEVQHNLQTSYVTPKVSVPIFSKFVTVLSISQAYFEVSLT